MVIYGCLPSLPLFLWLSMVIFVSLSLSLRGCPWLTLSLFPPLPLSLSICLSLSQSLFCLSLTQWPVLWSITQASPEADRAHLSARIMLPTSGLPSLRGRDRERERGGEIERHSQHTHDLNGKRERNMTHRKIPSSTSVKAVPSLMWAFLYERLSLFLCPFSLDVRHLSLSPPLTATSPLHLSSSFMFISLSPSPSSSITSVHVILSLPLPPFFLPLPPPHSFCPLSLSIPVNSRHSCPLSLPPPPLPKQMEGGAADCSIPQRQTQRRSPSAPPSSTLSHPTLFLIPVLHELPLGRWVHISPRL